MSSTEPIPKKQTVALVRALGGPVEFDENYPVPVPGQDEVLAKVLYAGVCQSDLHTKSGTACTAAGTPITTLKLPHVGGHEGIGRIVALGPGIPQRDPLIALDTLVGIRFASRICRRCDFCLAGTEQYCDSPTATNHLLHEDGAFQEYVCLDAAYLTILPRDCDPVVTGPVLCAGLTTYKAVSNAQLRPGQWLVVVGAGGGLGMFAVQYGILAGANVVGIDTGKAKSEYIESLGARFLDFRTEGDVVAKVRDVTGGGAHAVIVTAGSAKAFADAADMLRVRGTLCVCGIPPGGGHIDTTVATIAIKGLTIKGNLVGSLKECMEAVDLVRTGKVKPRVFVRPFRDLPKVYEELERGDIAGRVVLKIGKEPEKRATSRL